MSEQGITLQELERQLREAERPFGMTSEQIAKAAERGELAETPDFDRWPLLYAAWQRSSEALERRRSDGLIEA